ncbi:MAG TPA: GNAT family N-acetyltransferase, partial [Trebonia sp.]
FHDTSLVAERDGELAGFLIGFMSPSKLDSAYIHFVGVNPRSRGNGLARRLYETFFDRAKTEGRRVVRAVTASHNSASIAFHTAMGFTVTDPIPGYDGPSDVKVLFQRELTEG